LYQITRHNFLSIYLIVVLKEFEIFWRCTRFLYQLCAWIKPFFVFILLTRSNTNYSNWSRRIINQELCNLYIWLTANKLTLTIKKPNLIIFCPAQKGLTYHPKIIIFDNKQNKNVALEHKECVKYLGILIDHNLSWKHHVDFVALKVSRVTGLIAKLRYFVPTHTLLTIYQSFIAPYLTYGLGVRRVNLLLISCGTQAAKPSPLFHLFF